MDAKLEATLREIVEQKTLSLEGVAAVQALRERVAKFEAAEAAAVAAREQQARGEVEKRLAAAEAELSTLRLLAANVEKRSRDLAVAEAALKPREELANRALTIVETFFKNRTVRETISGSDPTPPGGNSYMSRDRTQTEE